MSRIRVRLKPNKGIKVRTQTTYLYDPTISAQVNSDWNANSGVAQILNKPTLATVATSGAYSDLSGKPTIPTVNNPTITLTQGGTTKGSFTLNQSSGATIDLDAGGGSPLPIQTGNSGKFLTTDGTNASWATVDALPDQTGNNGKALLTDGKNAYWGDTSGVNLFDNKWSDHILNDISWLRADTFSWQSGEVYKSAYEHLVEDYNNAGIEASKSDTIGGIIVWYRLCADGHKVCPPDQESNVLAIYNATGVAWYYIIDTGNQSFKLPRTKWGFTGVRDSVGNYVPESLPKPTLIMRTDSSSSTDTDLNAIYGNDGYTAATPTNTGGVDEYMHRTYTNGNMAYMDIFHSSYQDGAPVQQRATQMYLYFYVGNYTKSATEQTAGITTEVLNGKLDTELGNATATTKQTVVGWGMPDYTAKIETQNNTYTAPTKGWFYVVAQGAELKVYINGSPLAHGTRSAIYYNICYSLAYMVNAGDVILVEGMDVARETPPIAFYPCKGVSV